MRWVLAFVVGLVACAGEVPFAIRDEIAKAPPGVTTVVFFTDFQCPYCRRTHAALEPLAAERKGGVRVVIRHVPLPRHPDAKTAARAEVCFEKISTTRQGDQSASVDEYRRALFDAQDLSEAEVERIAELHGVARDAFQRCVSDPSTDARIERDIALFESVNGDGVPLVYVGRIRLEGEQSSTSLGIALDEAARRR